MGLSVGAIVIFGYYFTLLVRDAHTRPSRQSAGR